MKLVEATLDSGYTRYAPNKLVGDKAYVASSCLESPWGNCLFVVDISNSENLQIIGLHYTNGYISAFAVVGNKAYVAQYDSEFVLIRSYLKKT